MAMARDAVPRVRNLYLSGDPRNAAPRVNVGDGGVATVLRFAQDVDPTRTKMLGWEGWFEPLLMGGKVVVLVPLQEIPPEDRFLLYDGPIESMLRDELGPLGRATRLYGRVWTGGPQVVICAVARLSKGQLRKRPESKPGTAVLEFSSVGVDAVDSFR